MNATQELQTGHLTAEAEKIRQLNIYKALLIILAMMSGLVAFGGKDLLSKGGKVPKTQDIAIQTAIERRPKTQIAALLGNQPAAPQAEATPTEENLRDYQKLANAIIIPFTLLSLCLFGGAAWLHVSAQRLKKDRP